MDKTPPNQELRQVPIGSLIVDPNQPRRDFGRESELKENLAPLEALASSIKDQGILQPILARPHGNSLKTCRSPCKTPPACMFTPRPATPRSAWS